MGNLSLSSSYLIFSFEYIISLFIYWKDSFSYFIYCSFLINLLGTRRLCPLLVFLMNFLYTIGYFHKYYTAYEKENKFWSSEISLTSIVDYSTYDIGLPPFVILSWSLFLWLTCNFQFQKLKSSSTQQTEYGKLPPGWVRISCEI